MTTMLTEDQIPQAAAILQDGGLVVMPTETVYGLAAHALHQLAVTRVFQAKERPANDPLIVHVPPFQEGEDLSTLQARGLVADELPIAQAKVIQRLMDAFWPGPLTLIVPRGSHVPDAVTSGLDTVAIRMPAHPLAQQLLQASGLPLVAPSANRFGRISPTTAQAALEELDGRVDAIVDGGPCAVGVESTVVQITEEGVVRLLRPGGTPQQRLEDVLQTPVLPGRPVHLGAHISPGLTESHYAPRKPLVLVSHEPQHWFDTRWEDLRARLEGAESIAWVGWGDTASAQNQLHRHLHMRVHCFSLGPAGDLEQGAHKLFATLRAADASDAVMIIAQLPAERTGLGAALVDRLTRASADTTPLA